MRVPFNIILVSTMLVVGLVAQRKPALPLTLDMANSHEATEMFQHSPLTLKEPEWAQPNKSCNLPDGSNSWKCGKDSKITEVLRTMKHPEPDLVCEVMETRDLEGRWTVFDSRLFCRREVR